ncbi:MAG TPA: tRNA (adenosine(37)-N6)-threonylcarbamoyltransferase complex ATPase subunit type 1 TsaE [Pirellulales bacterium]
MNDWHYRAADEAATARLADALAAALPESAVIALDGPLGAGKTRLVQLLAAAAGIDPSTVTSPTFVLVQQYPAARPIFHFDAYRLRDADEFRELGPEEYFNHEPGWSLVEWAERVAECLPLDRLAVRIVPEGPSQRLFVFTAGGPRSAATLRAISERIGMTSPPCPIE